MLSTNKGNPSKNTKISSMTTMPPPPTCGCCASCKQKARKLPRSAAIAAAPALQCSCLLWSVKQKDDSNGPIQIITVQPCNAKSCLHSCRPSTKMNPNLLRSMLQRIVFLTLHHNKTKIELKLKGWILNASHIATLAHLMELLSKNSSASSIMIDGVSLVDCRFHPQLGQEPQWIKPLFASSTRLKSLCFVRSRLPSTVFGHLADWVGTARFERLIYDNDPLLSMTAVELQGWMAALQVCQQLKDLWIPFSSSTAWSEAMLAGFTLSQEQRFRAIHVALPAFADSIHEMRPEWRAFCKSCLLSSKSTLQELSIANATRSELDDLVLLLQQEQSPPSVKRIKIQASQMIFQDILVLVQDLSSCSSHRLQVACSLILAQDQEVQAHDWKLLQTAVEKNYQLIALDILTSECDRTYHHWKKKVKVHHDGVQEHQAKAVIASVAALNRAGRRHLLEATPNASKHGQVLAGVSHDPNAVYYHLREAPFLICR